MSESLVKKDLEFKDLQFINYMEKIATVNGKHLDDIVNLMP